MLRSAFIFGERENVLIWFGAQRTFRAVPPGGRHAESVDLFMDQFADDVGMRLSGSSRCHCGVRCRLMHAAGFPMGSLGQPSDKFVQHGPAARSLRCNSRIRHSSVVTQKRLAGVHEAENPCDFPPKSATCWKVKHWRIACRERRRTSCGQPKEQKSPADLRLTQSRAFQMHGPPRSEAQVMSPDASRIASHKMNALTGVR